MGALLGKSIVGFCLISLTAVLHPHSDSRFCLPESTLFVTFLIFFPYPFNLLVVGQLRKLSQSNHQIWHMIHIPIKPHFLPTTCQVRFRFFSLPSKFGPLWALLSRLQNQRKKKHFLDQIIYHCLLELGKSSDASRNQVPRKKMNVCHCCSSYITPNLLSFFSLPKRFTFTFHLIHSIP